MDEMIPLSDQPTNPGSDAATVGSLSQDYETDVGRRSDDRDSVQHGVVQVDTSLTDHSHFREQPKGAVDSVSEITIDENLRVLNCCNTTQKVEAGTDGKEISSDDRTSDSYKMKIVFDLSRKSHPASADGLLPTPDCPQVKITRLAPDSTMRQYSESTVRSDSQTRKLKRKTKDSSVTFSQDIPDYKGYKSIEDVLSFINGKVTKEEKSMKTFDKAGASRSKKEKERAKPDENSEDNSERENIETVVVCGTRVLENMHSYCAQDLKPDLSLSLATTAEHRTTTLAGGSQQKEIENFSDSVQGESMETITKTSARLEPRREEHKDLLFMPCSQVSDDLTGDSEGSCKLTPPQLTRPSVLSVSPPQGICAPQVLTGYDQSSTLREVLTADITELVRSTSLADTTDKWMESVDSELPGLNSDMSAHGRGTSANASETVARPNLPEPSTTPGCFPHSFPPEKLDVLQKASDQVNHQPRGRRNYRGGWMDTAHTRMPAFQQSWGPRLSGQDFTHGWHQGLRFPGQGVAAEHLAVPFPAVLHPHRMQALQQTLMPIPTPAAPLAWKKWRTPMHQENRNNGQLIAAQEEKPAPNTEQSKKKKRNARRNGKEQSKKEDLGVTESAGACVHLDRGDSVYRPHIFDGVACSADDADLGKCFNQTIINCAGSVSVLSKNDESALAKSAPFKKPIQTLQKCSRKPVYVHDKRIEEIKPLDIGIVFGWDPSLADSQPLAGGNSGERELCRDELVFGSPGLQFHTMPPTAGTGLLCLPDFGGLDTIGPHGQTSPQLGRSVSCNMQAEVVPTSSNTSTEDGNTSVCESRSDSAISFSALANEGLMLVQYGCKVPLREGETMESRRIYYQHIPDGPYDRKFVEDMAASMTSLFELATVGQDICTSFPMIQKQ